MTVIENDSPKEFFEGPFEVSDLIPFTFPYADRTDVMVKIGDEDATYGVEYEISAESPSSILVKVNIDNGVQVTVYRETSIDQQSSYPQNSKFRSEQVESDLDKICMIQQEQKETLTRCLRVPVENIAAFDGELPSPQEGKILVWSDEGKIVNSPSTITEIEDSVNTAVSDAATALSSASGAVLTANSAEQKATTALNQSATALNNSIAAVTSANSAVSTANSASADAASAVEAATYASEKVDSFAEDIDIVIEAAEQIEELEDAIDEAIEAASTAEQAAATATEAAEEAVQALSTKQDVLVSGTNIKTINNKSILGSGNVNVGTVTSVNNVQPVSGNVTIDINNISNLSGDLDNKLNKQQITNCILEVPQRIQYTLADGVLTILQGSVLVIPYGTTDLRSTITVGSTFINSGLKVAARYWDSTNSKFYVWAELQADLVRSATAGGSVAQRRAFVSFTSSSLSLANSANTASASSDAGATQNAVIFYNTTENLVKSKSSGTIQSNVVSFPIMITESDATYNVASVKQVFNGMGYIGSVIWADKDVHIVIPNGRNTDGTLKNNDRTSTGVATIDVSSNASANSYVRYTGTAMSNGPLTYDAIENFNHINGDITAHRGSINICKYVTDSNGVIISTYFFTPLNVSAFYSGSQTLTDMGLRNPNIDINTTPASNMFGPYIRFLDKYDNYLAYLYYRQASTGRKSVNLMCEDGQGGTSSFQLGFDDLGSSFCTFPNTTRCDGGWVFPSSSFTVADNVTWDGAGYTYDISNFLPNDGYDYEILIYGQVKSSNTTNKFSRVGLTTDKTKYVGVCVAKSVNNEENLADGMGILVVGSGRYIKQYQAHGYPNTNAGGVYSIYIVGYRRLGENS